MRVTSRRGRFAVALSAGTLALTAACGGTTLDSPSGDGADPATNTVDLGEPNPASGDPVKIGVLGDGKLDNGFAMEGYRATTEYLNEYRGGINGRPIELVECNAEDVPAKATACGVTFAQEEVAAVLIGTNGQAFAAFKALDGTDIPTIFQLVADADILASDRGFVMYNATGISTASLVIAEENEVDQASIIVIDTPGAVEPVRAIAEPLYEGAGIDLELTPISAQVADPTPQVQQAISSGTDQFTVFGNAAFVSNVIRAIKAAQFDGPIITQITNFPADQVEGIQGGLEGVVTVGSISQNPDSEDRQLYNAVVSEYSDDAELLVSDYVESSFQVQVALADALALTPDLELDAASVKEALSTMERPIPMVLSGGMTFQCGADKNPVLPAICVGTTLVSELDADGKPISEEVVSPADAS